MVLFSCKKDENNKIENDNNSNIEKPKIDFDAIKKVIDNSSSMDINVFFAISVYHKYFISNLQDQANKMNDEEQKTFYQEKKIEFFKTIKYSEKEYNDFMDKNINQMNEYISSHPEIADYLISTN